MTRRMIRWGAAALLGVAMHRPTAPPAPMTEGTAVPAAMVAAGQPYAGWTATGRRFLAFDAAGVGRAVEVVGDLRTAGAVVIVGPGVGTTLADFDRGLGGVARRAPAAQARAI
ncbi:MAG TPA: hypothetical protein VES42_02640, partial [Pilimelia sp.]|nr:hypothetical protein [Pilimelia sp.]